MRLPPRPIFALSGHNAVIGQLGEPSQKNMPRAAEGFDLPPVIALTRFSPQSLPASHQRSRHW